MLSNKKISASKGSRFSSHQKHSARSLSTTQRSSDLSDYEIRTFTSNLVETLGVGGFGTVKKAIHKPTGQVVAVKVCDLRQGMMSFDSI